jgi:hypothetical protein
MVFQSLLTSGEPAADHPVCTQVLAADTAELILLPNLVINFW